MKLEWGEQRSDVVFAISKQQAYSYAEETLFLHENYGGEVKYCSRSGLTGRGYLSNPADLIKLEYYDYEVVSYKAAPVRGAIKVYAPMWALDIDTTKPFVISDGERVLFADECDLLLEIKFWKNSVHDKELELVAFNRHGRIMTKNWRLSNPYDYGGVNAARFLDLEEMKEEAYAVVPETINSENSTLFSALMDIYEYRNRWFKIDPQLNIITDYWDEDPRYQSQTIGPWHVSYPYAWRRIGNEVQAFYEKETSRISDGRYAVEGTPRFTEFEQTFDVIDFFSDLESSKKQLEAGALRKARKTAVFLRSQKAEKRAARQLLADNPDAVFTLQDSYEAGNCKPASIDWCTQYGLPKKGVSALRLLHHPKIDEMLNRLDFRKVVYFKLFND